MPSHHDYGVDCETFCGGTPDDEAPVTLTCIHQSRGLCMACQSDYDADPSALAEKESGHE